MVDVTWGYLNLRAQPTTEAEILAKIPDGTIISIVNDWQDWFLIEYHGITGYVSKDYVTQIQA